MDQSKLTRSRRYVILMTLAAAVPAVAGDGTAMRLERAAAVLHSMTEPAHGIKPRTSGRRRLHSGYASIQDRRRGGRSRLRSWVHVLPERGRMVRSRRPWCLKGVALDCRLAVSQLTSSSFPWIRNIARSCGENDLQWDLRRRQRGETANRRMKIHMRSFFSTG